MGPTSCHPLFPFGSINTQPVQLFLSDALQLFAAVMQYFVAAGNTMSVGNKHPHHEITNPFHLPQPQLVGTPVSCRVQPAVVFA
jgi:hypothetical protein